MTKKKFDVYGVGNAIVDILAMVPDSALEEFGLAKGGMTLMDTEQQANVLHYLEGDSLKLASGGSAANTMAAIAQSGGTGVYAGKVAHDTHGEFYKKDMEEVGILFPVSLAPETGLPTGTSVILTTPDAERTMCTHLGISATLTKNEIDAELISECQISYVEGYLWTGDDTRAACMETFEKSRELGVRAAFTLSDMFLVELFEDDFRRVIREYCDIVFCNADEARRFLNENDLYNCATMLSELCELVFLTDSEHGCHVIRDGSSKQVHGFPVKAIDTVGAGDAFAGGVLYGLTNGMDDLQAARWGNYFASRVVSQIGPRMEGSMKQHLEAIDLTQT